MLGVVFALIIGGLLIIALSSVLNAVLTLELLAQVTLFGLAVGIIGGLYPGIKASRVRPIQVLKGG